MNKHWIEKERDMLLLFRVPDRDPAGILASQAGYTYEEAKRILAENPPKTPKPKAEWMPVSENDLREGVRPSLGYTESKVYIRFFLEGGYVIHDAKGDLEITTAGKAYLDQLYVDLERASVRSMKRIAEIRKLPEFQVRPKMPSTQALVFACLWV